MRLLITGGCGFIGSAFVRYTLGLQEVERVVVLDALTYAGRRENLALPLADPRVRLVVGDICDETLVNALLEQEAPDLVLNFAAESHVDRSIASSAPFVRTNVEGTRCLLDAALNRVRSGPQLRFLQVSTDEVYGDLGPDDPPFEETTPIAPRNPYSASKAAADLLALSYATTHELDVVVTRSSNNYGPRQYPEKLIPRVITRALRYESIPVYGDGSNVRDWLHVEDNCRGIWAAATRAKRGQVINLGGHNERTNLELVETLLDVLERPRSLIEFVRDRPGHDRRYAISGELAWSQLGWRPVIPFERGLRRTADTYREALAKAAA